MTHVELAESVLAQASVLALGIGTLLTRFKRDFFLGNLLADVMVGKKLSVRRKRCHDWGAGWRLLEHAHTDQTRAFAYGFLTHLAADTVAHNEFVPRRIIQTGSTITLGHLYWELMADQLADPRNRKTIRRLLREPAVVHEQLLEDHLYPDMKWFGFNHGVFTSLHRLTHGARFHQALGMWRELSLYPLRNRELDRYKAQALDRMTDLLIHGRRSAMLREDPNGYAALASIKIERRKGG